MMRTGRDYSGPAVMQWLTQRAIFALAGFCCLLVSSLCVCCLWRWFNGALKLATRYVGSWVLGRTLVQAYVSFCLCLPKGYLLGAKN